jgi:hypothetical protein
MTPIRTAAQWGIIGSVFTQRKILCGLIYRCVVVLLLGSAVCVAAQPAPSANDALPDAPQAQSDVSIRSMPINILRDQKTIWTSPFHLRAGDLKIVVPLLAATGVASQRTSRRCAMWFRTILTSITPTPTRPTW